MKINLAFSILGVGFTISGNIGLKGADLLVQAGWKK
jgi:hypothetical protein